MRLLDIDGPITGSSPKKGTAHQRGEVGINKYDKHYYEKYALLSLCYILGLNTNDFEQKDKPDLQSEKYSMGIEVVRAIPDREGLTLSLVRQYFGKGIPGEEIVKEIIKNNEKGKFRGCVTSINGVAVISSTNGFQDGAQHKVRIIEKIAKKMQKFQKYKHFENNGLYCFTETGVLNETDYPDIIKACQESPFSIVIINCIDFILFWEFHENTFKRFEIPKEVLKAWNQKALSI